MAGSLLDGDDFSSIGSSRAPRKGGGSGDNAMKAKIALIVVCLGGAGYLIARQYGMFDSKPKDTRTKEQIRRDDEDYRLRQKMDEERQNLPGVRVGDA